MAEAHLISREQWADEPGVWSGEFEGGAYGAGLSVIFFATDEIGFGPKLHRHPYPETFIVRLGRARFTVGDRVKTRLVNEMGSDHPMPHPFHVHGAGRFIVLSRNGAPEPSLVWKDTVLVYAGETVDILLDVTNPGLWMAHCHIAEHNQAGMMFSFEVVPA